MSNLGRLDWADLGLTKIEVTETTPDGFTKTYTVTLENLFAAFEKRLRVNDYEVPVPAAKKPKKKKAE